MKKHNFLLLSLLAICLLNSALGLAAQEQAAAKPNSAIVPEQRQGAPNDRYLKLNQIVKENQGVLDLAFIGDSITQGWEGNGKEIWQKFYGPRKAVNLGIGGDRTQHVLWRLDNGNAEGIQPKACVVMIGTNNSADDRNTAGEMVEGVQAVVRKIREKFPTAKILLLGIFPRGEDFNAQRGKILQVNQVIRKMDDGQAVHYMDIGHLFVREDGKISKEIMPDFLHLTAQGYQLWAEAIEPKLQELLGKGAPAPTSGGPAGEWVFILRPPTGETMELSLSLQLDGEKVTGYVEAPDNRRVQIENGLWRGGQLSFVLKRTRSSGEVNVYEIKGAMADEQMKGTVNAVSEGQTVEWSARRKK